MNRAKGVVQKKGGNKLIFSLFLLLVAVDLLFVRGVSVEYYHALVLLWVMYILVGNLRYEISLYAGAIFVCFIPVLYLFDPILGEKGALLSYQLLLIGTTHVVLHSFWRFEREEKHGQKK